MRCVCPECWKNLEGLGLGMKRLFLCSLRPVQIEGLKEVGQCPRCKKYWTQEGNEVKMTFKVEEGKTIEFNPSKRTKRN
jgi:Zn-finger nucleic acid-binding protein